MPDPTGEKTEAPTPRRRSEERESGNVARSQDLTGGVLLFGAVLLLGVLGPGMFAAMMIMVRSALNESGTDTDSLASAWSLAARQSLHAVGPMLLALVVLSVVVGVMQVGILITPKPLIPRFSKLSPLRGLKQLFSMRSSVRLGMSLGKLAVIATVAVISVMIDLPKIVALMGLESGALLAAASSLVWALAMKVALILMVLGIADYLYQKWQYEQDMKMSKQEIKDELKNFEGDPQIKQRRAQVARQLMMQRVATDVPKADVVVTNPTHFSIALKYDSESMNAPRVIAKGADLIALRIRQIAQMNGIPLVERPPLARALFSSVEVGQEVPAQHYAAVAEILAYVYRLNGRKSA